MKSWSWWKKTGVVVFLSGLIIFLCAAGYYAAAVSKPLSFGGAEFSVSYGESLSSIANRLVDSKIIPEPYTLKLYARLNQFGTQIKAGEYKFPEGISLPDLVDRLVSGQGQIDIRITFIEGWTFKRMRTVINATATLKTTTANWSDQQIMAAMGHPALHPEGQFYPDTYHYRLGDSDLSIYRKAFALMQEKLDSAWANRPPDLHLKSRYEALILASIIEKESWIRDEQPQISGVFANRLRRGMRLQTDPTVIYGIGENYDGNITRRHLKTDTPYNTYTRHGLPPTPISLPGSDALYAALHPEQTEALYFVAKGGGRHEFSNTLEEHNAAVKKYILSRKNDG